MFVMGDVGTGSLRRAAVVMGAVSLMVACSSGDDDTADDADVEATEPAGATDATDASDPPADATDSSGGGPAPGAPGELPGGVDEDFPVPFPDGWVIDTQEALAGTITTGAASVLFDVDDFDRVVAFYDDWAADRADIDRVEAPTLVRYLRADPLMAINILRDFEHEGGMYTGLQVSAASE